MTLWAVAHQAPLSMGFSRQEYWSRLCKKPNELGSEGTNVFSKLLVRGVARLSWRLSGRWVGRCRAAQLAIFRQMSGQMLRGSALEYQADKRAGVARLGIYKIKFVTEFFYAVAQTQSYEHRTITKLPKPKCMRKRISPVNCFLNLNHLWFIWHLQKFLGYLHQHLWINL